MATLISVVGLVLVLMVGLVLQPAAQCLYDEDYGGQRKNSEDRRVLAPISKCQRRWSRFGAGLRRRREAGG